MKFTNHIDQHTGTILLEGRFTFETHPAFKACTANLLSTPGLTRIVLDMEQVTHMDASSLGAVLLLRDAALPRISIALRRPSPKVMQLFKVVQFDRLFEMLR